MARFGRRLALGLSIFVIAGFLTSDRAVAQPVDSNEASVRVLRHAVATQRDGRNLSLLFALRQLRDPDLAAFFHHLVDHSQWQVQVHAVLGLAEISSPKRVDSALIERVSPAAQSAIIATALDLNLLDLDQMAELWRNDALPPISRAVLLAECVAGGAAVDHDVLRELAASSDDHVSGLAVCLLAQLGQAQALAEYRSRLTSLEARRRAELEPWLVEAIRRYKLKACADWLVQWAEQSSPDSDLASRSLLTLLELEHEGALWLWNRHLGTEPSYQQRVRMGLLLLTSGAPVPPSQFDLLRPEPEEELLQHIVAVGRKLNEPDACGELIALLDLHHARTSEWAMERVAKLPKAQAARIYVHLIDRLATTEGQRSESVALAVRATAQLYEIDPEAVLNRLRSVEDDSVAQQALLLGLFEIQSPQIGQAAASLRRIGSGRADSLALLLMARNLPELPPADLVQLGKIAAGGGRVSEILQAQAAWLFLKHQGQGPATIATLFADAP